MKDPRFFGLAAPLTAREAAAIAGCRAETNPEAFIRSAAALDEADEGAIAFISGAAYRPQLRATKAAACVTVPAFTADVPAGTAAIVADNVGLAYGRILRALYPEAPVSSRLAPEETHAEAPRTAHISPRAEVSPLASVGAGCTVAPFAVVEDGAELGENCEIGAGAYIGPGVRLGNRCKIGASASLICTIAGDDCVVQAGARLGEEGFGFALNHTTGKYESLPHLGRVTLGNRVFIGANSCVARGSVKDTVLEDDARIDNLVQIGHNCRIGRGAILAGQAGIAGSCDIGAYCLIGGQAGAAGHLRIGDKSTIAAQSGVSSSLEGGAAYGGSPAVPIQQWRRQSAFLKRAAKESASASKENKENKED